MSITDTTGTAEAMETPNESARELPPSGRCALCGYPTNLDICPECGEAQTYAFDTKLLRNLPHTEAKSLLKWFRIFMLAIFLPFCVFPWMLLSQGWLTGFPPTGALIDYIVMIPLWRMLSSWTWVTFKLAQLRCTRELPSAVAVRFTSALSGIMITVLLVFLSVGLGNSIPNYVLGLVLLPVSCALWTLSTFFSALWERTARARYRRGKRRAAPTRHRWYSAFVKLLSTTIFINAAIKFIPYLAGDPTAALLRTLANYSLSICIIAVPLLAATVYDHVHAELTTNRPKPNNRAEMQSGGPDGLHKDGVV